MKDTIHNQGINEMPKTLNPSTEVATAERFISIDKIQIHPAAVRPKPIDQAAHESERATLVLSIRENGLLQAVLVRPLDGGRFELIDGSRRYDAVRIAGQSKIRATIRPMSDAEAMELAGVGNMLRREWDPIKRAEYLANLAAATRHGGAGMTVEEIARRFGHSTSWVKNTIRLAKLPEPWRGQVASGEIAESTARVLIPHIDKPAVLKAIEIHQQQDPKRWRVREDWQANVNYVLERLQELHDDAGNENGNDAYEQSLHAGREQKAAEPKAWAEERIAQQSEKLKDSLVDHHALNDKFESAPEGPLTPETAKMFLAPFFHDRDDLQMISAVAAQRAMELRS